MAVWTSVKNYVKKHQKGILISAAIAGGSYMAGSYAAAKIKDVQAKSAAERLAKENMKRRFQQNQNDCVFTVVSLLPTLSEQILEEMNIEAEWAKLQKSRDLEKIEKALKKEREAGYEIKSSDQVKEAKDDLEKSTGNLSASNLSEDNNTGNVKLPDGVLSFVRTFTSIYSITLLTLLSHIQLNLLGRFTYMCSVSVLNGPEPNIKLQQEIPGQLNPQTEHMFLSTSWWLLHRGWKKISMRVQEAADEILSDMPLKSSLNFKEAQELSQKLRTRIEFEKDGTPISYRSWMLPDTEGEEIEVIEETGFNKDILKDTSEINLRRLLDESKDYIDSPDFQTVINSCLNEVFAIFDHHAFAKSLLADLEDVSSVQEISQEQKTLTLAKLLPIVGRQSHLVIAGNEYLNAFAYIKELQAFSAMIYTQFEEEMKDNVK